MISKLLRKKKTKQNKLVLENLIVTLIILLTPISILIKYRDKSDLGLFYRETISFTKNESA